MSTLVLVVSVSLVTALFTPGPDHDQMNVPLLVTVHVNDNDDCTVSGDSAWYGVKNSIGVAGNEGSKGNNKQIKKHNVSFTCCPVEKFQLTNECLVC